MLYLKADNGKLSGRADGNVYMRNGRVRSFFVPRLVQNSYTTTQRSLFAQYSQAWAGLTQPEQDSWNNVDNVFKSDRFGNPVLIRGKQLFIERNVNLTMIGVAPVTSYPVPVEVPGVTSTALNGTTALGAITLLNVSFAPSPTDANVDHLVFATPVLGGGINRPKATSFRLIGVMAAGSTTPFNILPLYAIKYGTVGTTGQKVFTRLRPVSKLSGADGVAIVTGVTLA